MVVPVDLGNVPAEGAPLVGERLEAVGLLRAGALLEAVAVDDHGEVGELAVAGEHAGFPVAAFLQFAVAGHHENAPGGAADLAGDRHADRDRHAVAERPGIGLDAGQVVAVGVAVQSRQRAHIGRQQVTRKVARFGKGGVEGAGAVALAHDEAVAVRRPRLGGVVAEHAEIEGRQYIRYREIAAGVPLARGEDHLQRGAADQASLLPDRFHRRFGTGQQCGVSAERMRGQNRFMGGSSARIRRCIAVPRGDGRWASRDSA